MYCSIGHKTYHNNLDGVLQRPMFIELDEVLKSLYVWLSMLVLAKCFATYEEVLLLHCFFLFFFFSIWVFFIDHSRITWPQGKGEGISLTPHYHFHALHRHFDISRAIIVKSSPLHIDSLHARLNSH